MALRCCAVPTVYLFTPATETGIVLPLPQFMQGADLLMVAADEDNLLGYFRERTRFLWALNGRTRQGLGVTT
jgi:hypothetical protein